MSIFGSGQPNFTPSSMIRISKTVRAHEAGNQDLRGRPNPTIQWEEFFFARIIGHTQGEWGYKYSWEEVFYGDDGEDSSASDSAESSIEAVDLASFDSYEESSSESIGPWGKLKWGRSGTFTKDYAINCAENSKSGSPIQAGSVVFMWQGLWGEGHNLFVFEIYNVDTRVVLADEADAPGTYKVYVVDPPEYETPGASESALTNGDFYELPTWAGSHPPNAIAINSLEVGRANSHALELSGSPNWFPARYLRTNTTGPYKGMAVYEIFAFQVFTCNDNSSDSSSD